MTEAQKLYFDESGFTGDNLLHDKQQIFSYGSVATTDEEAKDFVEYLTRKYRIQTCELKGKNLVNSTTGKKAVDELLLVFQGRIKASVHNKKYALAGKIFEYVFEPLIADNSIAFYRINFHRFIANYIYMEFFLRKSQAEELFDDFEKVVRGKKTIESSILFAPSNNDVSYVLGHIAEFIYIHRESIKRELDELQGLGFNKWLLDLTTTAFHGLLAYWGGQYHQIEAYCDHSTPLVKNQDIYNIMINREDKIFTHISGKPMPLTFNLKKEIEFVDSKIVHGIQIADVVAAATAYMCDIENDEPYAAKWREQLDDYLIDASTFPEFEHIDLERPEVQLNTLVLLELLERSKDNKSLILNIDNTISMLRYARDIIPFNS